MAIRVNFLLLSFLFIFSTAVFSEAEHTILWKGIASASGYTVEIKYENGKTIFQNTKLPNVKVKLGQGQYSYRIGVLNHLKRIENWSSWHDLVILPIAAPIVNTEKAEVATEGNKEKIVFNGENIYDGTKAFVVQKGKKIPVEIKTSPDGKTSVITVDSKLIDKKKNFRVFLENPHHDPIQIPVAPRETAIWDDRDKEGPILKSADAPLVVDAKAETSEQTTDDDSKSGRSFKLWPALWRQALLPGWGNYHYGDKKTAYGYFGLLGATAAYGIYQNKEHSSLQADLRTKQDNSEAINYAALGSKDTNAILVPLLLFENSKQHLADRADTKAGNVKEALTAAGAIYAVSIIHILVSSIKPADADGGVRKHSMWSLFWRQALLPGWGHYHRGDNSTAYSYFGIIGGLGLYSAYQNKEHLSLQADYRTLQDGGEAIYYSAFVGNDINASLFSVLGAQYVKQNLADRVDIKNHNVSNSYSMIGAVYVASLFHILYTGYTGKPDVNRNLTFGFRPDEQLSPLRVLDPNVVRMDLRYSLFY